MDSDNSGSLQSSSGGDEEYDSRAAAADSISAFMNLDPTGTVPHVGLVPNPTLFDPIPGYPDPNPPSLLNPNMPWPVNDNNSRPSLRSDPISSYSTAFMNSPFQAVVADNSGFTASPPPPASARNPKKRSRASRRAPTTVLTTDTTNFRAMVQEFTGIPAPPFSSSPLSRNRLDLSALPPSYLRRPLPQKVQTPPSFPISASSSSPLLNEPSSTIATPSIQLPPPQTSNLYNISNPVLNSLLQSNTRFPFSSSFLLDTTHLEIPSNDNSNIKIGSSDEFGAGLGHGNHASIFQNLISSNHNAPRNDQHNALSPDEDNDHQDQVGLVNGNYRSFPGNSSINYTDSSSNFQAEKGTENATTRSEGMMERWMCSSE